MKFSVVCAAVLAPQLHNKNELLLELARCPKTVITLFVFSDKKEKVCPSALIPTAAYGAICLNAWYLL